MKFKGLFFGAFATVFTLTSCEEDTWYCTEGNGYKTDKYITPTPFTDIDIDVRADTYIRQGSYYEVRIVASENIIGSIRTDVRGGELEVFHSDGCVSEKDGRIKIYITSPTYEKITVNSSGTLENESFLDLNDLTINVNSSCDIELDNVALDDYEININGSGDCTLQGPTADQGEIYINGSGDVTTKNLLTNSLNTLLRGSGDAEVNVYSHIDATLSGSGNLIYYGNPRVNSSITGSGSIIQRN